MGNRIKEIIGWLNNKRDNTSVNIEQVSFSELRNWSFNSTNGALEHESKKFFSIIGIDVETNYPSSYNRWQQPIINQPEIGILGFISRKINDETFYLMQAKIEPGNLNYVQLSPTLQATKSNYSRVHKGESPNFLKYFLDTKKKIVLDQLQSEQGARFLRKRNRNIIIEIEDDIDISSDFMWLTLNDINALMNVDNCVNMDTRTVLSSLILEDSNIDTNLNDSLYSFDEIIHWMTSLKTYYELYVKQIHLKSVDHWKISDDSISHNDNKYFEVIPVKIEIEGREVNSWAQPMIKSLQDGLCALIIKKIKGQPHLLIQGKVECGNFDIIEMAPTVQCLTDNYSKNTNLPYLKYVMESENENIFYDTFQSEEGGRFYKEENRNIIILADESFSIQLPKNYIWLTLKQTKYFLKFNNFFNIQARSLISALVSRENEIY